MFSDLSEQCLTLGSGRRFVQAAADRICTPSSYLLVHPRTAYVDPVVQLIVDELDQRHFQVMEVDVREINASKLPHSLGAAMGIDLPRQEANLLDAMQDKLGRIDAIYLSGFENKPTADKKRWLKFLNKWAENTKQRIDQNASATVLIAAMELKPAMIELLRIETTMHLAWWWGIPSLLELQLVCRGGVAAADSTESQWREHHAVALASGDLRFLEMLWPALTGSVSGLVQLMNDYANQRGWTPEAIRRCFNGKLDRYARSFAPTAWGGEGSQLSLEPPKLAREAWSDGLLFFSPEYGCEVHAAAACRLEERLARARLWRAQISLISPQLDVARSMMCHGLTKKLGRDWPTRFESPHDERELEEVTNDPLSCQLGYLSHLLKKYGQLQAVNPAYRSLSQKACELRDDLSHLRPVDFIRYRSFHEAARKAVA